MLQSLIRLYVATWRRWPKATVGVTLCTLTALVALNIYLISGSVIASLLSVWLPDACCQSSGAQTIRSPDRTGLHITLDTPFLRTTRGGSTTGTLLSGRVPVVALATLAPSPSPASPPSSEAVATITPGVVSPIVKTAAPPPPATVAPQVVTEVPAAPNQSRDWDMYNWVIDYPKPLIPSDWTNLLNKHTIIQMEMCNGKRPLSALVVTCRQPCYAMAEGLNAFMTAYSLAVVTGRAFFINSPSHFPVETYFNLANKESLLPGETGTINWHMNDCEPLMKRFALAKSKGKDILPAADAASPIPAIISPILDARFNCDIMKKLAVNTSLPEVLRVGNNLGVDCAVPFINVYNKRHGMEEVGKKEHEPLFRSVFRRLFSFKPGTVNAVNKYFTENHVSLDRTVCFHVRTGAFAADRDAKFQPNLNMSDFVSCALAVEKRLLQAGSNALGSIPWILVSDKPTVSESLLRSAQTLSPGRKQVLLDTEHAGVGPVRLLMESNSVGSNDDAKMRAQAVERILFDLYLMSQCRFLIAGQSGFAAMAEMLGADWSHKKVFAAGQRMRGFHPAAAYLNGPCRRHPPTSGQ